MQIVKTYPPGKTALIDRLATLAKGYKVIAASKLHKVRATQLTALKRDLRKDLEIVVAKNRMAKIALKKAGLKGAERFTDKLEGQNALIFTNLDPFKLCLALEKNKVMLPAKAGDVATDEIVVPAGNTGIPPGPVLSEFKAAGIPTRIDSGSIWVSKDTVVAREGDEIFPKLAGLLARLGLKPIKAGLSVFMAYSGGTVLYEKDIKIDLESYLEALQQAYGSALSLAIEASYPARETLPELLTRAYLRARALSLASS